MRIEDSDNRQDRQPPEERDSIWSISIARRALYFGLFTSYALAGLGFLLWFEIFENDADAWPQTIHSIIQGTGAATVGAAGLALLTIEGPRTVMVVADYIKKRWIEPLEEKRRAEMERRTAEAREKGRDEGRAEGLAKGRAEWAAWNQRRLEAEANGRPFDEPPPGTSEAEVE